MTILTPPTYTLQLGWPAASPALTGVISAIWFCASGMLVTTSAWPGAMLVDRARVLGGFEGLAPGIDLTMLLAAHLNASWSFDPVAAILAASLSALPFLFALILRTTPNRNSPLTTTSWIVGNPLIWVLMLGGYGWAAVGFYGLWRLFADLPERPPHQGMPLAGVGLGGAYMCVPHFEQYVIPIAATLWLVAPHHMLMRHMRIFYVLSFTPMAMAWASYAYTDWLFIGGIDQSTLAVPPLAPALLVSGVCVAGPGLVFGLAQAHRLVRLAAIGCLSITALYTPTIAIVLAAAFLAQGALAARWQEPLVWKIAAAIGALAAVYGLEVVFSSG